MTTVTAKTLRDNLSQYLDRLQKGEEIMIIRHSEIIGTLKPATQGTIPNGATIAAMLERNIQSFSAIYHTIWTVSALIVYCCEASCNNNTQLFAKRLLINISINIFASINIRFIRHIYRLLLGGKVLL